MSVLVGIGASQEAEVYAAGAAAAEQMVSHLGEVPLLTLVFAATRFAHPEMLRGVRDATEEAPLIGCTSAGGISTWGHLPSSVVVVGVRGARAGFVTGVARGISQEPEIAGRRLAADLKAGEPGKIKAALAFPDGLASNNSALLRGLQTGLGSTIPIIGGSAGDDFYFQKTFQFFDDEVLTDSAVAAVCYGEIAIGIGVRHGWKPVGRPLIVTHARGPIIYELDGKPAVSVYETYLGVNRRGLVRRPLAITTMSYPLGLVQTDHSECLLRSALRVGARGSLVCNAEIPEGAAVRVMIGGQELALDAAVTAAREASEAIGQNRFKGALVFSNGGRQRMMGSETQGEVDVIRDSLGGVGVRIGGFYGYGEQAPVRGANTYHNESVVVLALG